MKQLNRGEQLRLKSRQLCGIECGETPVSIISFHPKAEILYQSVALGPLPTSYDFGKKVF